METYPIKFFLLNKNELTYEVLIRGEEPASTVLGRVKSHLDWNDCIVICTDGANAMTGKNAGAVSQIKSTSNCSSSHCILHRLSFMADIFQNLNGLDAGPDMRLQLSSTKPDINQLMKNKKQFHNSH
ncbi:unnamed protein product [Euphydryas editha]|uniref:Uncharacterized protein n=1 Tax=Euphydryas editha TaxID=104508 RepID=A0AAU9UD80_EUPED|nr:unnamed protein product [Euphydryas editha]